MNRFDANEERAGFAPGAYRNVAPIAGAKVNMHRPGALKSLIEVFVETFELAPVYEVHAASPRER